MRMRLIMLLAVLATLSACGWTGERTSPCACDWRPIGDAGEVA